MFTRSLSRLTALLGSAALVSVLALPAPALARSDTLRKLLLLGAAAVVVKAVIDNQHRTSGGSTPVYTNPGLSHADILDVQYDLRRAGFYSGRLDGIYGGQTRQAVMNWQQAYGFPQTGVLTRTQLDRLNRTATGTLSSSGGSISTTPLPDQHYYGASTLTRPQLTGLQADLQFLGYYSGPVDGVWGQRSQSALELYRRERDSAAHFNLRAQPGTLDLASVAISARQLEDEIAADLEQRIARSGY